MSTTAVGRPVTVSVVAVVLFIQGVIAVIAGIGLLIERNNAALISHIEQSSDHIMSYGWAAIVWGALALFVGWGLWHGASWARIVVAVLQLFYLAGGVYLLFVWSGYYLWQGIWQILVSLFVLWLVFNPRAEEFFHRGRAA